MPNLNITLSGETNSSANGYVTDAAVLLQIKAVMRHLQDRAMIDTATTAATATTTK